MKHLIAQATVKAMENNTDAINTTMGHTMNSVVQNFGEAQSAAAGIFLSLITIEVIVFFIFVMANKIRGEELLQGLVQKGMVFFVVGFMTLNWGHVAGSIRGYVAGAGGAAGGSSTSITAGLNPAAIADSGIKKVSVIFDANGRDRVVNAFIGDTATEVEPPNNPRSNYSAQKSEQVEMAKERLDQVKQTKTSNPSIAKQAKDMAQGALKAAQDIKDKGQSAIKAVDAVSQGLMTNAIVDKFGDAVEAQALRMLALLLFALLAIMVIFVHFYVALQAFIISVEFYIITSMTVCFIPFGVNKHLSYLTTGAINAVIASAVKLGVLVMILSLMGDPINQMTLSNTPDLREMLSLLFNTATMAFLVSRVPALAAGVFTGGGNGVDISSTVSSAVQSVMQPAGAAASMGVQGLGKGAQGAAKASWSGGKKLAGGAKAGFSKLKNLRSFQPKAGQKDQPQSIRKQLQAKRTANKAATAARTPYQKRIGAKRPAPTQGVGKGAMSREAKARYMSNRVPKKHGMLLSAIDTSKKAQKMPAVRGFKPIDGTKPPQSTQSTEQSTQKPKMGTFNPHHNTERGPTQRLGRVSGRSAQSVQAVGQHQFSVRHNMAMRQNHPVVQGIHVPKQVTDKMPGVPTKTKRFGEQ